jgi:uncharacterized OsmC-like protein
VTSRAYISTDGNGFVCTLGVRGNPRIEIKPGAGRSAADELLNAALAVSVIARLRTYARRARLPIIAVKIDVSHATTRTGRLLTIAICIKGELTTRQHQRLLQVAANCPLHQLLTAKNVRIITIDTLRGGSSPEGQP